MLHSSLLLGTVPQTVGSTHLQIGLSIELFLQLTYSLSNSSVYFYSKYSLPKVIKEGYDLTLVIMDGMEARSVKGGYTLKRFKFNFA